jgi:hypothetical protein
MPAHRQPVRQAERVQCIIVIGAPGERKMGRRSSAQ